MRASGIAKIHSASVFRSLLKMDEVAICKWKKINTVKVIVLLVFQAVLKKSALANWININIAVDMTSELLPCKLWTYLSDSFTSSSKTIPNSCWYSD